MNFVTISILALLSFAPAGIDKEFDPCSLLTDREIHAVQGHTPAQKLASEQPSGTFRFTQCFYRTPEYTNSVNVAVGLPLQTDSKRSGPRQYWQQQFHPKVKAAPGRKKKPPPKPIAGLGDEAFWVGDPLSGALYVLKGEVFLRVSVGGPTDEAQKIKRAKALATSALKRLEAPSR
ncbi:MAG TPA: hypothetical protein VFR78_10100 [Pyrinomonadaceae bacterium]|nr:hypothetical protein [Pyrinomonadaceae bacterium]